MMIDSSPVPDAAQLREAEARVATGEDEYLPIELTRRLMASEVPVRVWREHRGLSARALASKAGVSAAYLSQIETGKKPGSFDAMAKLARALGVDIEDLEPWQTRPARLPVKVPNAAKRSAIAGLERGRRSKGSGPRFLCISCNRV